MSESQLSRKLLLGYAVGSVPAGIMVGAAPFIVFYYNQALGVPAAWVGFAALLAALFDAITDPPVGALSDRTRSRLGRRHPYLFAFAIPMGIAFYLLWAPPRTLTPAALIGWLFALALLQRFVNTFYYVPYLALGAELSTDYVERTRITTARHAFYSIGRAVVGASLLLVFLKPTPEFANGQLNPEGYRGFALLFGLAMPVFALACAWRTREVIASLRSSAVEVSGRMRTALREVLAHRSLRAILLGDLCKNTGWGMSDALGLYMATYFWKISPELLFVWGVGMFAGLFSGYPFWQRVAARYDKKPVFQLGTAGYLFFFSTPYVLKAFGIWPEAGGRFDYPLYVLTTGFLAHFAISSTGPLTGSMLADVADLDELEHGQRREALIFGAESFSQKAFAGFGAMFAGVVVQFAGITPEMTPETAPPGVAFVLGLSLGALEVVLFGLAIFFVTRYDLDRERVAEIRRMLGAR